MAKRAIPDTRSDSIASALFTIGLAVLGLGLLGGVAIVRLNRTTKAVTARVVETHDRQVMGRRGPTQYETLVIQYEINGKSRQAEIRPPAGRANYSRSHVQVFYYPALPAFVWYYDRGNGAMGLFVATGVLGLLAMAFSVGPMLKARRRARPAK